MFCLPADYASVLPISMKGQDLAIYCIERRLGFAFNSCAGGDVADLQ
jgi:hypothetical protein